MTVFGDMNRQMCLKDERLLASGVIYDRCLDVRVDPLRL